MKLMIIKASSLITMQVEIEIIVGMDVGQSLNDGLLKYLSLAINCFLDCR